MLRVLIPRYGRLASPKVSASPLIWTIVIALAGAFSLASHTAGASPLFAKTSDASPPSMDDLLYVCNSPAGRCWFNLTVTAFSGDGAVRVVVARENVTERKRVERIPGAAACRCYQIAGSIHS